MELHCQDPVKWQKGKGFEDWVYLRGFCVSRGGDPPMLVLALYKLGRAVHTDDPSPAEVEAGGSRVQSHLQLHRVFKVSLGYESYCTEQETTPPQTILT